MKKLTIAIPTFNRLDYLEKCLTSIISQILLVNKQVDVFVFDNNSTDGTPKLMKSYCDKYHFVKYIRNEKNLGADGNFLKILSFNFNSEYLHIISDDDLYASNALSNILSFLEENKNEDFVYTNIKYFKNKVFDENLKYKVLNKNFNLHSMTKKEFIDIIGNEFSFLSGMIFKVEKINIENFFKNLNTHWLQSYAFFNSTKSSNSKMGFIGSAYIAKNDDEFEKPNWFYKVFGKNYYDLIKFSIDCGYDKKQMTKLLQKRWLKIIYDGRIGNVKTEDYYDIIRISRHEKKLLKCKLLSYCPIFIFKMYFHFKRGVKSLLSR